MDRILFDQKEVDGKTESMGMFGPAITFDYPVSPKENYRLLYEGKTPYWFPGFGDMQMMTPRIDPDNTARAFSFEAQPFPPDEWVGGPDKFGTEWVYVPVAQGSMVVPGNPTMTNTNDWQDLINFPDVAKWDWAGSAEANKDWVKTDKWFVFSHLSGLFERLISFMDFENAAVALIDPDQKKATLALLDAIADTTIDIAGRAFDAYGGFDTFNMHDDWGAQAGPFFSEAVCMEMIVPSLKKIIDFTHNELGIYYDMHSCGKNELLVPCYIAAGVDSWMGQPMNDKKMLYDKYGDKIILGIEPDLPFDFFNPDPSITLEDTCASAQRFIDMYLPNFQEKPVTMGFFGGPPGYDEWFYEASRKAFDAVAW